MALAHAGRILCVDLDGTLCDDAAPGLGEPHGAMIGALAQARQAGWYVLVNSARTTLDYDMVRAWLERYAAGAYDQLALGVKPVADVYVDDRGWLPTPTALLMHLEWRAHTDPRTGGDVTRYYAALAQEQLHSAFAQNVAWVPEHGAPAADERDPAFRVLIPITGGMDSVTLWQMARESGVPYHLLYCALGQEYADGELAALRDLLPAADYAGLEVCRLPIPFHVYQHILVGRNAIILLECLRLARERGWWGEVWFGALAGESPVRGGDKSRRFLSDIQQLLLPDLRVVTPLIGMDKVDEVRYWRARPGGLALLAQTKSCFDPAVRSCGHCQTCFRKYVAWAAAGEDPTPLFPHGIMFTPYIAKYRAKMQAAQAAGDFAHYSPARVASTLAVLDALEGVVPPSPSPPPAPHAARRPRGGGRTA